MNVFGEGLNAGRFAEICGGVLVGNETAPISRGRADSRLCRDGDLYVALPGERTDGNLYAAAAWEAGATTVLARRTPELPRPPEGRALIIARDPLRALQDAAGAIREEARGLLVAGITGSNGKTTTKEILAAMVRRHSPGNALVTEGNYNSDIGLPLTLLGLREEHRLAVLEMGMNRPGEMALLAALARPDVAVVTNIGSAHVGMLGSRKKVAAEKRRIFDGAGPDSVAVVGAEEPWADFLLEGYPGKVRRFGLWGLDGWDSFTDRGLDGFTLVRFGQEIDFRLPGRHNLLNAMAATEAARALGLDESHITAGLEAVRPASGRSEILRGAVTVIRDGYNANPESLAAALELFSGTETEGRRILVLGELLELGGETEDALRQAGGAVAEARPDAVFLLGESLGILRDSIVEAGCAGKAELFGDLESLREALSDYLRPKDLILLKGSRGSALERLDNVISEVGSG